MHLQGVPEEVITAHALTARVHVRVHVRVPAVEERDVQQRIFTTQT